MLRMCERKHKERQWNKREGSEAEKASIKWGVWDIASIRF